MILAKCISEQLTRKSTALTCTVFTRPLRPCVSMVQPWRGKKHDTTSNLSTLIHPVPLKPNVDELNVGAELSGTLQKADLLKILNRFTQTKEIKQLATEYGLDSSLQDQAFLNFRRYCLETESLPVDLHIILSDIVQGAGNITDIFPYFLRHVKQIFPHIECLDDLKKISDLRLPANWYPVARAKIRKIIFHAGPTNSGKTYHALEKFIMAKSGVYCGPLKLLVAEVCNKSNSRGTPCDLITGEERKFAHGAQRAADHISCSVEMVNLNNHYEVAVIDEIQLMRDTNRGWAWTRALLGISADEIHLCGESAAIDLVKSICSTTGESVDIRSYDRLTQLEIETKALGSLQNVRPGDCIVCFNKNDIFRVSRELEKQATQAAVIYGSLPPGTKLAQAAKFNDPNDSCKILVATNAIGMGLNLHIRRIIFYSLIQPTVNEKGEKEMNTISVSAALQIAGRAGRYGTQWDKGFVTTFKPDDLATLTQLLSQTPDIIAQAGLHPTADQIELYAYHLPNASLSNLMDIFVSLCTVDDSLYFMCNIEEFKFLADMIQHVSLPLRARYVFCCAPINRRLPFVCSWFLKFARQYSKNDAITYKWLCNNLGWPFTMPKNIMDLVHLESVFDVLDLYLWLSYRFMDLFPDSDLVRNMQIELDMLIQQGLLTLPVLLRNVDTNIMSTDVVNDENADTLPEGQLFRKDMYPRRPHVQGKLTEKLLAKGHLTPQMIQELQHEWSQMSKRNARSRLYNPDGMQKRK